MERDRIAQEVKAKLSRGRFARPRSPAWTVGEDLVTVSTPSGRTVSRSIAEKRSSSIFTPHPKAHVFYKLALCRV